MKKILFLGIVIIPLVTGCETTEEGLFTGAVGGAAAGALLGHAAGDAGKGAAIGAVAGGILGAAAGSEHERAHEEADYHVQPCPYGHDVNVSGFGPGASVRCPICNSTFVVQ